MKSGMLSVSLSRKLGKDPGPNDPLAPTSGSHLLRYRRGHFHGEQPRSREMEHNWTRNPAASTAKTGEQLTVQNLTIKYC